MQSYYIQLRTNICRCCISLMKPGSVWHRVDKIAAAGVPSETEKCKLKCKRALIARYACIQHFHNKEKLKLNATLIFKGFPPSNKVHNNEHNLIFSQTGTLGLWDCAILSSHFLQVFEGCGLMEEASSDQDTWTTYVFFFFTSEATWEPLQRQIFSCLILFVWEELSTTYLSQEEQFSQIFIVWVLCYNM